MVKIGFVFCTSLLLGVFSWAQENPLSTRPTKKIQHPAAAADGLIRIDADGNYIYNVQNELKNQASHIRIGAADNPEISVDVEGTQITFDDIYEGASKMTFAYDYEYFFTIQNGKLGLQGGISMQYAQGQGRLVSNPQQKSVEKFSFFTVPMSVGAVYRFEYYDRQVFAPYISGGGTYVLLAEKREDRSKVNATGAPGFYGAGGALFNITAFDRDMAADFLNEYGIGNLWVNLEFRVVQVTSEAFNYETRFIQGGISFDF